MKNSLVYILGALLFLTTLAFGQVERKDKAIFTEPKNEFIDSMRKSLDKFFKKEDTPKKRFQLDFSAINSPKSADEFTKYWHNQPVSQGFSGMCWCFSTTSFFESEIYRLTKQQLKLSELYTVYWEYVEKARRFIKERGNSAFGEGSEGNAVTRIWKQYGIVPAESYTGLLNGQPFHDHGKLFNEMNTFLQSIKNTNSWDEKSALSTIQSILNNYIGEPPKTVVVNGKQMTPKEYFEKVVKLNLDDYVEIYSIKEKPYYQWVEYEVPDNWWHSEDYYNVPLDDYMKAFRQAIRNGYTIAIGGDVSEAGYEGHAGMGVVPTFDIPSAYINEDAREFRFSNGTTGDDHGIHVVGYTQKDNVDWYLIKDSGAGSRNNNHPGYYFYHEDFVKLKMLTFMAHKDALKDVLKIAKK